MRLGFADGEMMMRVFLSGPLLSPIFGDPHQFLGSVPCHEFSMSSFLHDSFFGVHQFCGTMYLYWYVLGVPVFDDMVGCHVVSVIVKNLYKGFW